MNPSAAWHVAADAAIGFVARAEGRPVRDCEREALEQYGFGGAKPSPKPATQPALPLPEPDHLLVFRHACPELRCMTAAEAVAAGAALWIENRPALARYTAEVRRDAWYLLAGYVAVAMRSDDQAARDALKKEIAATDLPRKDPHGVGPRD